MLICIVCGACALCKRLCFVCGFAAHLGAAARGAGSRGVREYMKRGQRWLPSPFMKSFLSLYILIALLYAITWRF